MKTVKVNFVDFSSDFDIENNDFMRLLKKHFEVEISDDPEYLFYSNFGQNHIEYDCIKIFYTGECETPDFNKCDYAMGFDRLEFGDRYLRVPLYKLFQYRKALLHINDGKIDSTEREFCSFVVSNDQGMPQRREMFELLSEYKKVDSGGRFLNNIGGPVEDKYDFDSKHKFSLVFENCVYPGYTTEKIVQAFAAGTIPIYYGDPEIGKEFNTDAFVNCAEFDSFSEAVERVKQIDNDDELYAKMLKAPKTDSDLTSEKDLEEFLLNIFNKPMENARRRPVNARIEVIEEKERVFKIYNSLWGRWKKKIKAFFRRLKSGAI